MIKKFLSLIFCIAVSCTGVFAESLHNPDNASVSSETSSEGILKKVKYHRKTIYDSLELDPVQIEKIDALDKKFYAQIEPDLKTLESLTKKTENMANSGNCTRHAINSIKKDFRSVEKNMNSVKKDYDKELKAVLNSDQQSKYRKARKQKQAEMRKEIEKQKVIQREKAKEGV